MIITSKSEKTSPPYHIYQKGLSLFLRMYCMPAHSKVSPITALAVTLMTSSQKEAATSSHKCLNSETNVIIVEKALQRNNLFCVQNLYRNLSWWHWCRTFHYTSRILTTGLHIQYRHTIQANNNRHIIQIISHNKYVQTRLFSLLSLWNELPVAVRNADSLRVL